VQLSKKSFSGLQVVFEKTRLIFPARKSPLGSRPRSSRFAGHHARSACETLFSNNLLALNRKNFLLNSFAFVVGLRELPHGTQAAVFLQSKRFSTIIDFD